MVEQAIEANGDEMVFVSADSDAQRQSTQIQDLVMTTQVDGLIVIAYNSDQIASSMALAQSQGVPFVAIDRAPGSTEGLTFQVTGDPVADGELAAKEMLAIGEELQVLHLVGGLTDLNAVGRRDGFNAALEGQDAVTVVQEIPTDWDPTKALDGTSNALSANPEINAIYVPSDYLLPSVISALESQGRLVPAGEEGHVVIVTIDGDTVGCQALRDGNINATIATQIGEFGEQAVAAIHTAVSGGTIDPVEVQVPGLVLNLDNFDEVSPQVWGCQ